MPQNVHIFSPHIMNATQTHTHKNHLINFSFNQINITRIIYFNAVGLPIYLIC